MLIEHLNVQKGEFKVKVQNRDDLWYLASVIDKGDLVSGKTTRKLKLAGKEGQNVKIVKKTVFLKIQIEKIEFHKYTSNLRLGGIVTEGTEDIPKGSHHTFDIEEGTVISVKKTELLKHQLKRLKEATENKTTSTMICTLERDKAYFALLKKYGYDIINTITGSVEKKFFKEKNATNFYKEIGTLLQNYATQYNIKQIILGSPSFWREELKKEMSKLELPKIIYATCNSFGENAINEVLRRPETETALKGERISEEMVLIDELFKAISTDELAVYGLQETKQAAMAGAVKHLLITDTFIEETRRQDAYDQVDQTMRMVDKAKGEITIVSSDHEGGKKLDGLGGIAGILRYKLTT